MDNLVFQAQEGTSINEIRYQRKPTMLMGAAINKKTMVNSFEDTFTGFNDANISLVIHDIQPINDTSLNVLINNFSDGYIQPHNKYMVRIFATPV